ncbi:MAG: hypothetical protein M3N57_10830 [Actinomycetota bacterium]|nr:hypothetical protein [Actinomycetota bacterium]
MTVAARPLDTREARRVIPPRRLRDRLHDRIPQAWCVAAALAWAALLSVAVALEPGADDPAAIPSAVDALIATVLFGGLFATAAGLGSRRRIGFAASFGAALLLLGATLACPATGHHELAGWWYGQLAATGGLVGMSGYGLWRAPRSSD